MRRIARLCYGKTGFIGLFNRRGEAGVEEELAVAFHAEDGRIDEVEGLAAQLVDGGFDAVDGELVGGWVPDDTSFADVLAAGFELRLDEEDCFPLPLFSGGSEGGDDGGEDEGCGDEADVHGEEGDGGCWGMGGGRSRSSAARRMTILG